MLNTFGGGGGGWGKNTPFATLSFDLRLLSGVGVLVRLTQKVALFASTVIEVVAAVAESRVQRRGKQGQGSAGFEGAEGNSRMGGTRGRKCKGNGKSKGKDKG